MVYRLRFFDLLPSFNKSFWNDYFPSAWRDRFIIPSYKSRHRQDIENYRRIAKLSVLAKPYESVTKKLCSVVKSVLFCCQHGFSSGRSTFTNLLKLTCTVHYAFFQRKQVDVIYIDFSQTLGKVGHSLLTYKLKSIGFLENMALWFICSTQTFPVVLSQRGSPWPSFVLFINNLPTCVRNASVLTYADDGKVFRTINSSKEVQILQSDLNGITSWCCYNGMLLKYQNCEKLSFSWCHVLPINCCLEKSLLNNVCNFNDLRVVFDNTLRFNQRMVTNKAKSLLGFMKR